MSARGERIRRGIKTLVWLALIGWGATAGWWLWQARKAGQAMSRTLESSWPPGGCARIGIREKLLAAADRIERWDFAAVAEDFGPPAPLARAQRIKAQKFLSGHPELWDRFLAVAAAGQVRQQDDPTHVGVVREALGRALSAAADRDAETLAQRITQAESVLDETATGEPIIGSGPTAVTELLREVEQAFKLSGDLLTEGHLAAAKLMARASWLFQEKRYRESAQAVRLAAGLLGVETPAKPAVTAPKWFAALAAEPQAPGDADEAGRVVELAEAMAKSGKLAPAVRALVRRARREFDAKHPAQARWWASVALNAMGTSDDAVTAAAQAPDPEPDNEDADDEPSDAEGDS